MPDALGAVVAAISDPVTSGTDVIIQQGPWAAAFVVASALLAGLAWQVIKQERKRADAAEARAQKLEEYFREKVGPLLTDINRYLADDLARERRRG